VHVPLMDCEVRGKWGVSCRFRVWLAGALSRVSSGGFDMRLVNNDHQRRRQFKPLPEAREWQ